jgi:hypothetical protein
VATRAQAMKPKDFARVVIDTTVQPKAVAFPTDAKLLNRARERWSGLPGGQGSSFVSPTPALASWRSSSTSATLPSVQAGQQGLAQA